MRLRTDLSDFTKQEINKCMWLFFYKLCIIMHLTRSKHVVTLPVNHALCMKIFTVINTV